MAKTRRRVILDSNFLLVPFQFKVDVISELEGLLGSFEPLILSTTIEELKRLAGRKPESLRRAALAALEYAVKHGVIHVKREAEESYDDVIVRVAKDLKCIVATNDKELRRRLRKESIPTVFLRQKRKLELDGYVD